MFRHSEHDHAESIMPTWQRKRSVSAAARCAVAAGNQTARRAVADGASQTSSIITDEASCQAVQRATAEVWAGAEISGAARDCDACAGCLGPQPSQVQTEPQSLFIVPVGEEIEDSIDVAAFLKAVEKDVCDQLVQNLKSRAFDGASRNGHATH